MMPMRHFGLFTAFGIISAMVLSFTFIPCLIVRLPSTWFRPPLKRKRGVESRNLVWIERFASQRTNRAFWIGLIILTACAPGMLWLEVQDSWVDNFDKRSELVSSENDFNRSFWGSYRFDVVFQNPDGMFYENEGATMMEEFCAAVEKAPFVGGVVSYLDVLEEVARGMEVNDRLSALSDRELQDVATLAEMSGDPRQKMQLINDDGTSVRARVFVNSPNYSRSEQLANHIDRINRSMEEKYRVTSHISGDIPVAIEVVRSVVTNQMRSISFTLAGIAILLLLTFPRGLAALVVMIPVTTTAMTILAIMGYAGMPLGIATSMFASLTIGVGVDFALHFFHNYKRQRKAGKSHQPALDSTLQNAGQAIRWNALVLVLGFSALIFSGMKPDRDLGILLAVAIAVCYVMTILFLPRMLKGLTLGIALLIISSPVSAVAETDEPGFSDDPHAREIVRQLETDYRRVPRIVEIDFNTVYERLKDKPFRRSMWGVLNGDTADTRMIWIVTNPPRMAGTTLLFVDKADMNATDSTWLYLSLAKYVRLLRIRSAKAMIPGTALTYEDSRGFVSIDKYNFKFINDSTKQSDDNIFIRAEPINKKIRAGVGVYAMILQIDQEKRILERIDYLNKDGDVFKTYLLKESIKIGDVWLPTRMSVQNQLHLNVSTAIYTYWPLQERPSLDFFKPEIESGFFLDRLKEFLEKAGVDFYSDGFEKGRSH
jgi:hypothetical protein